jgi:hypothetical protein
MVSEKLKKIEIELNDGPSKVLLSFQAGTIIAKFNPNKENVKAGPIEIENVLKKWIPRLGPGFLTEKDHFGYLKKEYKTYLKKDIEVIIDWKSLENLPFESSEISIVIAKQVLGALTSLGSTPANTGLIKKLPQRILLKASSKTENISFQFNKNAEMLIEISGNWLSSDSGKFYVLPNKIIEDIIFKD